jgi:spermidine synthase
MPRQHRIEGPALVLVLSLFFFSGSLALIYEVVWTRLMMNVFGSTALAVGTVLAAFMFGMAVGAWRIGKIADQHSNCLRLYAWLEIGIALAALVSHILLSQLGPAHQAIHALLGSSATLFALVRFLLAFLLVLAPTILMGATLPVLTRFLMRRQALVGVDLSTLYSINTCGAVTGVLLTGFFLIGRYGVHVPVYVAVSGNLLIGCIAWIASMRTPDTPAAPPTTAGEVVEEGLGPGPAPGAATIRIVLLGLGISGFTSFAYEIYWTRSLVFILGNSTYALTTMLSAFLTGIALGGYLVRFPLKNSRDRTLIFGWLQVFLGVFSALALPMLFAISDPQSLSQYLNTTSAHPAPLVFTGFGVA